MNRGVLWALGLTLVATLYAGWKGESAELPPASPAVTEHQSGTPERQLAAPESGEAASAPGQPLQWSARAQAKAAELLQQPIVDLFVPAAGSRPAPPPPTAGLPPSKARPASQAQAPDTLPPLPLQEAGLWRDAQQRILALNTPEGLIYICEGCHQPGALRKGDRLLGQYRIDAFTDNALTLTYLPLMRSQILPLGARP